MKKLLLALLAGLIATPAAAQLGEGAPHVTATSYTVHSAVLDGDRIITVRLPAGYEEQPEMRFPVVYLLDGGPDQDFDHIAGIVQSRDMNWSFERFILVGVQSVDRRHYFAPAVDDPAPYEAALGSPPGGTDDYRRWLSEELMPMVDAQFRTNGHDAVIGESLGALFVVETMLKQPTLFDDYIAVSPSMWWDEMHYGRAAPEYLSAFPETGDYRLYVTVANEGFWHREGVERLVDALRDHAPDNLRWTFVPVDGSETHGTLFHPMALDAFRALYGTPDREYKPTALLGGEAEAENTPEEQARLDTECTLENSRPTTPEAASAGRERLYYQCLLFDLGPRPREGTLHD